MNCFGLPGEKKSAPGTGSVLLFLVANDFFHFAIQRITQGIQRFSADMLSLFDAIQRIGRKPLLIDQIILRDIFAEQGIVKGFVADHFSSPGLVYHAQLIDYA